MESNPLSPLQFGFRKKTFDWDCALLLCQHCWEKGELWEPFFFDLRKAFDTVNHSILLAKLASHNISVNTLQWFKSYLQNRKYCTRIKSTMSSFLESSVAVPQGSILGPLLFSIYINDLPAVCPDIHIQLYADNAVMYVHAKSSQSAAAVLQVCDGKNFRGWCNHA